MTIAVCYPSPEGIVLGADSTISSFQPPNGFHYFNHNQKLFEIGQDSTFGIVTWGLGGFGPVSYRTLIAELADDLEAKKPADMLDVATRWSKLVWDAYSTSALLKPAIDNYKVLNAKAVHDPNASASPTMRTKDEEETFTQLRMGLPVGFCIGGYVPRARVPMAFEVMFDPLLAAAPTPQKVVSIRFWGAPRMIDRLLLGADAELKNAILLSNKWTGTDQELTDIMLKNGLTHGVLPIRDAIDFVHTCIYSTIKALKFSSFSQICGGPIELAVITTDRKFRWVHHKAFDTAILEGT